MELYDQPETTRPGAVVPGQVLRSMSRGNEAWVDTDQTRFWRFEGDRLHIISAPVPNPNVAGSDLKPPQAAVVKSHGGERCGKVGTMIPAGMVEGGERKRTAAEVSKGD